MTTMMCNVFICGDGDKSLADTSTHKLFNVYHICCQDSDVQNQFQDQDWSPKTKSTAP